MNKYLKTFLWNICTYIPGIIGIYLNGYFFFIKSIYIVYLIVVILGQTGLICMNKAENIESKHITKFYLFICYLLDIPMLIILGKLDFKLIFILYVIFIFNTSVIHITMLKNKRGCNETKKN